LDGDDLNKGNKITAFIGLQNEPLGGEPLMSVSFGISYRVFCIAFALSRIEKERAMKDFGEDEDDEDSNTIKIKLEKDECGQESEEIEIDTENSE
jgi:hypothetical protein